MGRAGQHREPGAGIAVSPRRGRQEEAGSRILEMNIDRVTISCSGAQSVDTGGENKTQYSTVR